MAAQVEKLLRLFAPERLYPILQYRPLIALLVNQALQFLRMTVGSRFRLSFILFADIPMPTSHAMPQTAQTF